MRTTVLLVALTLLIPGAVQAQQPQGWPGMDLPRLPTIYVLDDTGRETEGKLLRLEPDSLVMLVAGTERRFEAASVRRIQKRGDSLRNGAIIGAVVGAAFGLLTGGLADCSGERPSGPCPGARAALFLISTGTWAAIGTAIDVLIPGRTTLYDSPTAQRFPGGGSREGSAAPPSRARIALNLSVRW